MATKTLRREFPWSDRIGGQQIRFTLMTPEDGPKLLAFAKTLSKDDMMYLRMDISRPEVIQEWCENIRIGRTITVLAENDEGQIIAYCTLHTNSLMWTRHIGEMRVLVHRKYRGIGLSRRIVTEMFQIARELKLKRVQINIAREQSHFQRLLEELGFKVEALLTDWLMDKEGRTHDLLIMSAHLDEY